MSMKRAVRLDVNQRLKTLSKDYIDQQSSLVFSQLCNLPQFVTSTGFSVYLSMGGEVNTQTFLSKGFEQRQRVFIPKILGKKSADMFMLEVPDMKTIEGFAKNNWGIPEPPMELISVSQDGTYNGAIDLVLLPGVAFDSSCNRLGHGKGYYDCFLERLMRANAEQGRPVPYLVGLALDEQIIAEMPLEAHDKTLDAVITPTTVYFKKTQ